MKKLSIVHALIIGFLCVGTFDVHAGDMIGGSEEILTMERAVELLNEAEYTVKGIAIDIYGHIYGLAAPDFPDSYEVIDRRLVVSTNLDRYKIRLLNPVDITCQGWQRGWEFDFTNKREKDRFIHSMRSEKQATDLIKEGKPTSDVDREVLIKAFKEKCKRAIQSMDPTIQSFFSNDILQKLVRPEPFKRTGLLETVAYPNLPVFLMSSLRYYQLINLYWEKLLKKAQQERAAFLSKYACIIPQINEGHGLHYELEYLREILLNDESAFKTWLSWLSRNVSSLSRQHYSIDALFEAAEQVAEVVMREIRPHLSSFEAAVKRLGISLEESEPSPKAALAASKPAAGAGGGEAPKVRSQTKSTSSDDSEAMARIIARKVANMRKENRELASLRPLMVDSFEKKIKELEAQPPTQQVAVQLDRIREEIRVASLQPSVPADKAAAIGISDETMESDINHFKKIYLRLKEERSLVFTKEHLLEALDDYATENRDDRSFSKITQKFRGLLKSHMSEERIIDVLSLLSAAAEQRKLNTDMVASFFYESDKIIKMHARYFAQGFSLEFDTEVPLEFLQECPISKENRKIIVDTFRSDYKRLIDLLDNSLRGRLEIILNNVIDEHPWTVNKESGDFRFLRLTAYLTSTAMFYSVVNSIRMHLGRLLRARSLEFLATDNVKKVKKYQTTLDLKGELTELEKDLQIYNRHEDFASKIVADFGHSPISTTSTDVFDQGDLDVKTFCNNYLLSIENRIARFNENCQKYLSEHEGELSDVSVIDGSGEGRADTVAAEVETTGVYDGSGRSFIASVSSTSDGEGSPDFGFEDASRREVSERRVAAMSVDPRQEEYIGTVFEALRKIAGVQKNVSRYNRINAIGDRSELQNAVNKLNASGWRMLREQFTSAEINTERLLEDKSRISAKALNTIIDRLRL